MKTNTQGARPQEKVYTDVVDVLRDFPDLKLFEPKKNFSDDEIVNAMMIEPDLFRKHKKDDFYLYEAIKLAQLYHELRERYEKAMFPDGTCVKVTRADRPDEDVDLPGYDRLIEAHIWMHKQITDRIREYVAHVRIAEKVDVRHIALRVMLQRRTIQNLASAYRWRGARFSVPVVCKLTGLKKSSVYNMASPSRGAMRNGIANLKPGEVDQYVRDIQTASFIYLTPYEMDGQHATKKKTGKASGRTK